uniref:C2H2-type domain-containing protein n=1 Tax=Anopheles atroparvus TaxID=41427 RepID=A0AAG5CVR6_ANOAO
MSSSKRMGRRRETCLICTKSFACSDVIHLNMLMDNDRTVAEAILAFVNVECTGPIAEEDAFICRLDCYQRLMESIEFQDLVRGVFRRILASVEEPAFDDQDSQDRCLATRRRAASMEIDDVIDWDETHSNDVALFHENVDSFDVQTISNEPDPIGQSEEEDEVGKSFALPDAEFITMHMKFQNFEYFELNGHRCCGCAFIARTVDELSQHANNDHRNEKIASKRQYVCSICSTPFKTEQMLQLHGQNQGREVFLCKCCGLAFSTKQNLMKHMTHKDDDDVESTSEGDGQQNGDDTVKEPYAEDTLNETLLEEQLVTHVDDYDDYRILHTAAERCCSCGRFFANYDLMLDHAMATHAHPKTRSDSSCPACGETFKSKKCLKHHQATNSSFKKIFFCKPCKVSFVRIHLLARHLLTSFSHRTSGSANTRLKGPLGVILRQKSNNSSQFPGFGCCFVRCGATFDDETQLQTHVEELHAVRRRIHINERTSDQIVCNVCQLGFSKEQNLQRHRYSWQMRKVNICSYCGKGFPNPSVLWEHEQVEHTHTSPQFECEHCGKRFKKKSLIKLHLVTHQEERKFGCDQCGSRFHFGHQLKKHKKAVHATELPYECKYCDHKMPNKERYDQHMRKHTGERPYECRHNCGRAFSHSTDRRRHEMATHTGEKPHKCQTCGTAYVRKRELQQHLQKHPDHVAETGTHQREHALVEIETTAEELIELE